MAWPPVRLRGGRAPLRRRRKGQVTATDHIPQEASFPVSPNLQTTDLPIQGMTCAACVRRVERALTKVEGVEEAVVNLVTQRATVRFDPDSTTQSALTRAVEAAGYGVQKDKTEAPARSSQRPTVADGKTVSSAELEEERQLRRDLRAAVLLTVPLLVLAMSHGFIPGSDGALRGPCSWRLPPRSSSVLAGAS